MSWSTCVWIKICHLHGESVADLKLANILSCGSCMRSHGKSSHFTVVCVIFSMWTNQAFTVKFRNFPQKAFNRTLFWEYITVHACHYLYPQNFEICIFFFYSSTLLDLLKFVVQVCKLLSWHLPKRSTASFFSFSVAPSTCFCIQNLISSKKMLVWTG